MRFTAILILILLTSCGTDPSLQISGQQMSERDTAVFVQVIDGHFDVAPKFREGRAPLYPTPLRDKGVSSGFATLAFTIGANGRASAPRVIESSHPQFAAGVAHVLPTWRFSPAQRNGVPVEVVVSTSIKFQL